MKAIVALLSVVAVGCGIDPPRSQAFADVKNAPVFQVATRDQGAL